MAQDLFDYPKMVETALRGVMREALARAAREGLFGDHHFYVTFQTRAPGVRLSQPWQPTAREEAGPVAGMRAKGRER